MQPLKAPAYKGLNYFIRGSVLIGFSELVRARGGEPEQYLERAGLSRDAVTKPDSLISWAAFGRLLEISASELNGCAFGLELAMSLPDFFPNMGATLLIATFAETFREWIDKVSRYWRFNTNAFVLQLIDEANRADVTLRFFSDSLVPFGRQEMEYIVGTLCRMARTVTEFDGDSPLLVRFRHCEPSDISFHKLLFRCPLEFEKAYDEIEFDRRILDCRSAKHRLIKGALDPHIRLRIHQTSASDQAMSEMIALAIRSSLGTGECSDEFVASALGLSTKKMQRLLRLEQMSFSRILDDVRHSMARQLLSESRAPIHYVAGLLDYSTPAAFTLAFKRWTGLTPRAFRARFEDGN